MLFLVALLLLLPGARMEAQAEKPVRTEEVIYSLMSYNGRDYSPTFCREGESTICLIADADSFGTVRTSLVYYWPTTGDWYTDSKSLNVLHSGTLEIRDRQGVLRRIEPVAYTYFSEQDRYGQSWRVLRGAEAEAEWARYSAAVDSYQAAMSAYGVAKAVWDEQYAALATRIGELRERGAPVDAELERLESMRPPEEPAQPWDYVVPPAAIRTGYVVRLPAGTYSARLITPEGLVLEGSDKTIIAFARSGFGLVGYDVIPSDRWTRAAESNTAGSVLYSSGGVELYVRPFFQDRYNDLFYRKAIRNDASGNPNLMTWVKVRQIEGAAIELVVAGRHSMITEQPYYVEQSEGTALGYSIVPFDGEGAHQGLEPTLRAYAVPVSADAPVVSLRLYDAKGTRLPSGDRAIRVVRPPRSPFASLVVAVLPLAVGAVVLTARRRKVQE